MLAKYSVLLFLIWNFIFCMKFDSRYQRFESDGEDLDSIVEAFNKSRSLYRNKQVNYFSDYYNYAQPTAIVTNTANLMKTGSISQKSFRKLNAIANNVKNGDETLRNNPVLKNTLKLMLNNNSLKINNRVNAAKLAARLNDLPVTIQMTNKNPDNKPSNMDSYIVVPRIKRIYRPDYYVENYKAGNWDS